jgi:hypothetical protein
MDLSMCRDEYSQKKPTLSDTSPESGCHKSKGRAKGSCYQLGYRLIFLPFRLFHFEYPPQKRRQKGRRFHHYDLHFTLDPFGKRFHLRPSIVIICERKKSVKKELSAIALFLFQLGIKLEVAVMAKTRDIPIFHRLKYGTALLLGVSAFGVSAMSYVLIKFSENVGQIVERIEIKTLEIYH